MSPDGTPDRRTGSRRTDARAAALTLAALGVVFCASATSPLYALESAFSSPNRPVLPVRDDVFGLVSMVVWTLTMVVSIKYVTLIMRANNDGEGGILALIALVQRASARARAG